MTQEDRIYTKHQAFETTYQVLKSGSQERETGFDAPKKYHYAPEKLDAFKNFSDYTMWANELHASATSLIRVLNDLYTRIKNCNFVFGMTAKRSLTTSWTNLTN